MKKKMGPPRQSILKKKTSQTSAEAQNDNFPDFKDFQKEIKEFYDQNKEVYEKINTEILKLPKSQQLQLQGLFMDFRDKKPVDQKVARFKKTLPKSFQETFNGLLAMMEVFSLMGNQAGDHMSPEQAKELVLQAVKEGRLSEDQANKLLNVSEANPVPQETAAVVSQEPASEPKKSIVKSFWSRLFS